MMKNTPIKIMRADIDLGGCVLKAYRNDDKPSIVVIVPANPIEIMTMGHDGPETFYAQADAHVVVNREGLRSAGIYVMFGKSTRCVNLFTAEDDVSIITRYEDEFNFTRCGYDVEVKPDTPLYSHDDCERTSEYDKVCSLLKQAETR